MSTHRKIEWALFILGVIGTAVSVTTEAVLFQVVLFSVGALFAGLHVFHLYDGRKANQIVAATSAMLVVYTGFRAVMEMSDVIAERDILYGFGVAILLVILSFRLRRDFR